MGRKGHLEQRGDVLVHGSRCRIGHLEQRGDVIVHGSRCRESESSALHCKVHIAENDQPASLLQQADRKESAAHPAPALTPHQRCRSTPTFSAKDTSRACITRSAGHGSSLTSCSGQICTRWLLGVHASWGHMPCSLGKDAW